MGIIMSKRTILTILAISLLIILVGCSNCNQKEPECYQEYSTIEVKNACEEPLVVETSCGEKTLKYKQRWEQTYYGQVIKPTNIENKVSKVGETYTNSLKYASMEKPPTEIRLEGNAYQAPIKNGCAYIKFNYEIFKEPKCAVKKVIDPGWQTVE